ncbi:MAG: pirin family protein [Candidatus Marinimicrobia bacterium]|nr:pirin family protein [Candidatus Neomarinimicrobiota bacterium]
MSQPSIRRIIQTVTGTPTTDGAGVRLTRLLGSGQLLQLDPFLLLDEFRSDSPDDYIGGFPSHPHRGFETITYMKAGTFQHKDSTGNEALIDAGGVQWMTAGRGIIHSEMPMMTDGLVWGYQLWLNLPADRKMMDPGYQNIQGGDIPVVEHEGAIVRILAGEYGGQEAVTDSVIPLFYLDVTLEPGARFSHPVPPEMNAFLYIYDGEVTLGPEDDRQTGPTGQLLVMGPGDRASVRAGEHGTGFLIAGAQKLGEPIVRGGPFVMNTQEQLQQAYLDYQRGVLTQ